MREGAPTVAVAERPDVGNAGPQSIVDLDVAMRVDLDARRVEPEVVGVRPAADGEQHVRAELFGFARRAIDADGDLRSARREADAFGVAADYNSFGFQGFADRVRHALVLAADQARHLLHHCDRAPKAPEYLRELEPDIASSDDNEARGQGVEFEQPRAGQRPHLIATWEIGRNRAATDVDEEAAGFEDVVACLDCSGRQEAGLTLDEGAVRQPLKPGLEIGAGGADDLVLARHDGREIDAHGSGADAKVAGAPCEVGCISAGDEGLGGRAAAVDASSADELALDLRNFLAGCGDPAGHRRPGLAGADHDRVETAGHGSAGRTESVGETPPSGVAASGTPSIWKSGQTRSFVVRMGSATSRRARSALRLWRGRRPRSRRWVSAMRDGLFMSLGSLKPDYTPGERAGERPVFRAPRRRPARFRRFPLGASCLCRPVVEFNVKSERGCGRLT